MTQPRPIRCHKSSADENLDDRKINTLCEHITRDDMIRNILTALMLGNILIKIGRQTSLQSLSKPFSTGSQLSKNEANDKTEKQNFD